MAGIPEGRTLDMVFCATCNEHSLRRHKKNMCQRCHSAVSCCCYRAPPQAATAAATATTARAEAVVAELARRHAVAAAAEAAQSSSSLLVFSLLAALSAGCRSPAFNAQWLDVVCSEVEVEVVAVVWLRPPCRSSPPADSHSRPSSSSSSSRSTLPHRLRPP